MVAVQVRDKHGIEACQFLPHLAHGQLGTLTAVDEERLVTQVQNLSRGRVLEGRQGRTRTQYCQCCFHKYQISIINYQFSHCFFAQASFALDMFEYGLNKGISVE